MHATGSQATTAPHRGLSRRLVLTLPALAGAGVLAGCQEESVPVVPASETPTPQEPSSTTMLLKGVTLTLDVGPLVRAEHEGAGLTILPIHIVNDAQGKEVNAAEVLLGGIVAALGSYRPLRLVDVEGSRIWSTTTLEAFFDGVPAGSEQDLYATFGPVDVDEVTVFLSRCGFVDVPVVDADDERAPSIDVAGVVAAASPFEPHLVPASLERYSEAIDGSSSGLTTEEETTIQVDGDVTFAVDSAELSADADAVLSGVAGVIAGYDSGTVTITGHTDDVAEEAYNQTLSEQRAQAVSDRLGQLTDLSAWTQEVSGKGELEPAVPNDSDENRQCNRRVEVVVTPTGGTDGAIARSGTEADIPEPTGPSATGAKGVTVNASAGGGQLIISLQGVTRRGGLLFGELDVKGGTGGSVTPLGGEWFDDPGSVLSNARDELSGVTSLFSTDGLTLLAGADRVYPVDYLLPDASSHRPLAELDLTTPIEENEMTRICVVWPDTGEDTVIVDHPDGGALPCPWRLTDVPVTDA